MLGWVEFCWVGLGSVLLGWVGLGWVGLGWLVARLLFWEVGLKSGDPIQGDAKLGLPHFEELPAPQLMDGWGGPHGRAGWESLVRFLGRVFFRFVGREPSPLFLA